MGSGLTRAELREKLRYYDGLSEPAFAKAFDRDIASVRQSGYPISVDREYRYRYDGTAPLIAPISSIDLGLLRSIMSGIGRTGLHAMLANNGLQKILAGSVADPTPTKFFRAAIPDGDEAPAIARALQYRRTVTFHYRGTSSAETHSYALYPQELSVHFDAFYVRGVASREGGPWELRSFKISRIVDGSLSVDNRSIPEGTTDSPGSDQTDYFTESEALLAIRPGAAAPLVARGELVPPSSDTPTDSWPVYRFTAVNRQHLFEDLLTYGTDVSIVGGPVMRREWAERLSHIARMPGDCPCS